MEGVEHESQRPLIGEILPNADQASIAREKLTAYALDPGHVVGRHKAHVFQATLAIELEDWGVQRRIYTVSQMTIREHDTVELIKDVDGWPAGTIGAVVSMYPHSALVEVDDPDGERELLEDLVSVPHEALRVVDTHVAATSAER